MFLVNGKLATLRAFNREDNNSVYDDQNYTDSTIKVCPYGADDVIKFGVDTVNEATGYYMVKRTYNVLQGDQIIFNNRKYTVLKVQDMWIFNRIENKMLAVK